MLETGKPRALAERDLYRVAEIERALFSDPWSVRAFRETLDRPEVWGIAIDDPAGALIGYAISVRMADEGEILNIAVAKQAQGQGAGRKLLDTLLDHLRQEGATRVFLEVRRSNEAAIALYRRVGFQPLGLRRAYYGRPREDALTMELELGSQNAEKR